MIKKILNEATVADAVDKAEKILDNPDVYSGQGDIEKALDKALKVNRRAIKAGDRNFSNVLFVGAAGTGKTSRIMAWAKKNNIRVVKCISSTMDDTDLGGVLAGDMETKSAIKLATTQFDELGTAKDAVLFLDEWNRAPKTVRATLLTLIQDHEIPDPRVPGGARFLPNFLFTIAATNPTNANYDTDVLDDAERGRVMTYHLKSNILDYLDYVKNRLETNIKNNPDEREVFELQMRLAEKILRDPRFTFDSPEEIEQSHEAEQNGTGNGEITTYRNFYRVLQNSESKEEFLDNWNRCCNSLKKKTVEEILKDFKDVDDKANDALKGGTESQVFANRQSTLDKLFKKMTGN